MHCKVKPCLYYICAAGLSQESSSLPCFSVAKNLDYFCPFELRITQQQNYPSAFINCSLICLSFAFIKQKKILVICFSLTLSRTRRVILWLHK